MNRINRMKTSASAVAGASTVAKAMVDRMADRQALSLALKNIVGTKKTEA